MLPSSINEQRNSLDVRDVISETKEYYMFFFLYISSLRCLNPKGMIKIAIIKDHRPTHGTARKRQKTATQLTLCKQLTKEVVLW